MIVFNCCKVFVFMGVIVVIMILSVLVIVLNCKVMVGVLCFILYFGSFVVYECGYFFDVGLDVEFKFFQVVQLMVVVIVLGDIDYGVIVIMGGLIFLVQKGVVKVIGGVFLEKKGVDGQKVFVFDVVFGVGFMFLVVIGGKIFGILIVGLFFYYMGFKIVVDEGVEVKFKFLQKVGVIIGVLKFGQIDVWIIVLYIVKLLVGLGVVYIIGNVVDYILDYQVMIVFILIKNVEGEQQLMKDFFLVYLKGVVDYDVVLVQRSGGVESVDEMVLLIYKYVYIDCFLEKVVLFIINGVMYLNEGVVLNILFLQD